MNIHVAADRLRVAHFSAGSYYRSGRNRLKGIPQSHVDHSFPPISSAEGRVEGDDV